MPLIECPDCGKPVSDKAPACIHCGRPLGERPAPEELDDAKETFERPSEPQSPPSPHGAGGNAAGHRA